MTPALRSSGRLLVIVTGCLLVSGLAITSEAASGDANTNGLPDEWEELCFSDPVVVDGALIAGGNILLKSPAIIVNGNVIANGSVGKTCTRDPVINGSIEAVGAIDVAPTAGYSSTTGAVPVVIPDYRTMLNLWHDVAVNGGLHYGSNVTFGVVDLQPTSGVIYVDGDVSFGSGSRITGTLVAEGTITIDKEFYFTSFNTNWPALIAVFDVLLSYSNSISHVIWAGRDVTIDHSNIGSHVLALNDLTIDNSLMQAVDPKGDPDGDRLINKREFLMGKNPLVRDWFSVAPWIPLLLRE